jgi:uncharacterized protein (TIRG00374 family)
MGGLVSLWCALVLFSRVESEQLVRELLRIDPGRFIAASLVGVCFFPARSRRWQLIFPRAQRPKHRDCFAALAFSNFVNNLVPARGGDLLRCLLVKQSGAAGASVALGTLALEKILDGLSLVLVLLVAVLLLSPPGWVMTTALLAGAVFSGALALIVVLRLRSSWVLGLATRVLDRCGSRSLKERGVGLLSRFIDGLGVIESGYQVLAALALTAAIWLGDSAVTYWLSHTMDIPLTLGASAVISAIIGLGYMIPAGPASVGSYEAAAVAALGLFGIHGERALAAALVLHACSLVLTTGLGLLGLALVASRAPASPEDLAFSDWSRSPYLESAQSPGGGSREASERPVSVNEVAVAADPDEIESYRNRAS